MSKNQDDEIRVLKILECLIAGLAIMLMLATIVVFLQGWMLFPS